MKTITMIGCWALLAGAGTLHAETLVLPVQEDTWITGLTSAATHGADPSMGICPVAMYWIYLKFDLTQIKGVVTAAELRMRRVDGSRPEEISVYLITDDSWTEGALNGQNRPAPQNPPLASALARGEALPEYDRWTSDFFLDALSQQLAGDRKVSLMVREDPDVALDIRHYFSKEAQRPPEQKPQLILTVVPDETVAPGWLAADVGIGVKPSFDFDAQDRLHIMGMTEDHAGVVWYDSADYLEGPWSPSVVAGGYFYGPGDVRCDPEGTAHLCWHNHTLENADHLAIGANGVQRRFDIQSPGMHDGWDNALAIDAMGRLHLACVFPSNFGAQHSLQYGRFEGNEWTFESMIEESGSFMYGLNTSIAVDSQGGVHVVYCEANGWTTPGDLKYAARQAQEPWTVSTIVSNGVRGRFPSIALDHWDRPNVAWLDLDDIDPTHGTVRYGVLNGGGWDVEDVDILEDIEMGFAGARKSVSLALNGESRPRVAYADRKRIAYAIKPFDEWEITNVLANVEPTYNGLVVLRLNSEEAPAIVFWQPSNPGPGLVRLVGLRDPSIHLFNPAVNPVSGAVRLGWTSGPEDIGYIVEKRNAVDQGDWTQASGPSPLNERTWIDETPGTTAVYRIKGVAAGQ